MTSRGARAIALAGLAGIAGLAACAKVAPPPGGPEDRTPPEIVEMIPARATAAVDPSAAVVIVFSERPDERSVMRALSVFPDVRFEETTWREDTLRLVPEDGWPAERNTTIRIEKTAKDRRGNQLSSAFEIWFTTKALADSGRVQGKIWNGREVERDMSVVVAAYAAPADSLDPDVDEPTAIAAAKPSGAFELEGLDTAATYRLIAIADRDGDGRPGSRGEIWEASRELVAFDTTNTFIAPDFLLGTLDSLGTIAGEVLADSGYVPVVVATDDESEQFVEVVRRGATFSLTVPTGRTYEVGAFVDVDRDSVRAETEPWIAVEERVALLLTKERRGLKLDLRGLLASPDSADVDTLEAPR